MIRNVVGSILALVGATAAVWSPFRAWYDGRPGRNYPVADLFGGIGQTKADLATSILLPLAVAALVTVIGVVLRSRLLVLVAGVIVLGFTVLWMVRQGQAAGNLSVESDGSGLGQGVGLALGGGILLLLGAALMSGRRRADREPYDTEGRGWRRRHRHDEPYAEQHPEPYTEPYADPHGRPEPYTEPPGQGQSYGQRPYGDGSDETRTAEYPRYDEGRYDDRPGPDEPGPGQGGPGPDAWPGGPDRPRGPHRGRG
ncbi:hypothetical protein ACF068_17330 [Streptomyces sp. NPDC016309]|uniref:hypothetical protein n=1 Tax=Streptomyces sp. NPDC016309 TaxID=3364965 RepID=UPI0036F8BC92